MTMVTKRIRATAAGLLAAGLLAAGLALVPAVAAQASTAQAGFTGPNKYEWWFPDWQVRQDVWPLTEGAGVTVAVLDSGVQASVPDLRGVVLPGADMTGAGTNGRTDLDTGTDGHGTAVAVLIAGQGYGTGTVGLAPRARILPVVVGNGSALSGNGAEEAAQGIRFAVNHGAQVISMSFGTLAPSAASCDPQLQNAVAYALDHNVVLVASAGDLNLQAGRPAARFVRGRAGRGRSRARRVPVAIQHPRILRGGGGSGRSGSLAWAPTGSSAWPGEQALPHLWSRRRRR